MNQEQIVANNNLLYQQEIKKHGSGLKAMHWPSYKRAARRYKQLLNDIDIRGKTVLDVGCGHGNLLPFLIAQSNNFDYQGIDIMPEFITQAQSFYPGFAFSVDNFWADSFTRKADIILSSGTMNLAILDLEMRKAMVKKLFEQANTACIFNMSGQHPLSKTVSKSGVFAYIDALEILNFCFSLTDKIVFRHHYHHNDFTIALFHKRVK